MVSKKCKKKKKKNGEDRQGIGKKMAIFDLEWGRNSAPREGQKMKMPCSFFQFSPVAFELTPDKHS